MKFKILTIIFAAISLILSGLFLVNWSYSMDEIEADNYESLLHEQYDGAIYIDNCLPGFDSNSFSIISKSIKNVGVNYGVNLKRSEALHVNLINEIGDWYSFENTISDLEYNILYKKIENSEIPVIIKINAKYIDHNRQQIKEIVRQLCEKEGFIVKKTLFIYGSDIIIKEQKDRFIIGRLNGTYDERRPIEGLYLTSFSKKRLY